MTSLWNQTRKSKFIDQVVQARSLWERTKGLLGTKDLPENEALWIHSCNSIHTFFMAYAIDCVFLDSNLRVSSIKENIRPFRIVWPQWGASSVLELKAGALKQNQVQVGDQLHVGD